MSQEKIISILVGVSMVTKNTLKILSDKSKDIIEKKFLKGNYVSQEEFKQLKELVLKLEKEFNSSTTS